jgi:glycine dehydrogenase
MIENGEFTREDNPLVMAPHTVEDMMMDWDRPYSKEKAFFPLENSRDGKFWPSVNRIDHVYGDKNLFCSCIPLDEY